MNPETVIIDFSKKSNISNWIIVNDDVMGARSKGDEKTYQLRVKTRKDDQHAYIAHFDTEANWQNIHIPRAEMYPSFRGMQLDMDYYPAEKMEELAFLFGNKGAEMFRLEIESVILK